MKYETIRTYYNNILHAKEVQEQAHRHYLADHAGDDRADYTSPFWRSDLETAIRGVRTHCIEWIIGDIMKANYPNVEYQAEQLYDRDSWELDPAAIVHRVHAEYQGKAHWIAWTQMLKSAKNLLPFYHLDKHTVEDILKSRKRLKLSLHVWESSSGSGDVRLYGRHPAEVRQFDRLVAVVLYGKAPATVWMHYGLYEKICEQRIDKLPFAYEYATKATYTHFKIFKNGRFDVGFSRAEDAQKVADRTQDRRSA
jgi:hypothetical protein